MLRLSDSPQKKKRDRKVYRKMSHARDRQRVTPRVGGTEPKTACRSHDRHDEGGERRRPNVRAPWRFRRIAWNAAAPPRVAGIPFSRAETAPLGWRSQRAAPKNRLTPRLLSRKEVAELGEQMRLCFTPCGTVGCFFRCQIVFFV